MLFDLRGRGRRRTIQVIYLGLAIVLGGGLILFGVGTGGGGGGLLNAIGPNGGTSAPNASVSPETKIAEKEVKADPTNAQGWSDLAKAEYQDAGQGLNPSTQSYDAAGKADLQDASKAWQRYLKLEKNPDPTLAQIMAEAYQDLGDYANEAQAWEIAANANPKVAAYWEYMAEAAYLAKETDLGNLAAAKAVKLTPKAQRATLQATLKQAASQATTTATPATTTK